MKKIPMLDLQLEYQYMKADVDAAIQRCLEHQRWIFGPEVAELEQKIASYLDVKHCIGCSSGTDALVLSLRALAIKVKGQEYWEENDLIITTPFTFTATGDAILRSGARPLFVDIDLGTYNIAPEQIREALDSSPYSGKVVGIVPVHLYGRGCEMGEIIDIAREHGLFVVEDVAQAFGGEWMGKKLGSIGTTGCFSFFPSKNLGGFGDGGMVSTDDADVAEFVRKLIRHGGKDKYNVEHIGYNARLDTLQAAIILAKFIYIDEFNERRIKIAEAYNTGLNEVGGLIVPSSQKLLEEDGKHVYHQYTLRTKGSNREKYQEYLNENGISTMVYYPTPLHEMKVFEQAGSLSFGHLENSEYASKSVFSLPMEPLQSEEATGFIVDTIKHSVNVT